MYTKLCENDIFSRRYFYPATNDLDSYKGKFAHGETPVAERVSKNILTLPMYADLAMEDVDRICGMILSLRMWRFPKEEIKERQPGKGGLGMGDVKQGPHYYWELEEPFISPFMTGEIRIKHTDVYKRQGFILSLRELNIGNRLKRWTCYYDGTT